MDEILKELLAFYLKEGDVFQTKRGWWVRVTEVLEDKIKGYFGCDQISVEWPICLVAGYRAVWSRKTGEEITDPDDPKDWLKLDPRDPNPLVDRFGHCLLPC